MKRPHSRSLFSCLALALLTYTSQAANAQSGEQCSLDQTSAALNSLPCEAVGAFVSTESVVTSVVTLCEYAPTEESCHRCFRRARDKVVPSMKTLMKLRLLPTSMLRDLREELLLAEDDTCYQGGDLVGAGPNEDEYASGGSRNSGNSSRSRSGGAELPGQDASQQTTPGKGQRVPPTRR